MKLLTASQIREADKYTIEHEPIASTDLMERAALKCTNWIIEKYNTKNKFVVFTGPGNNGGDGLAISRQLIEKGFLVDVYHVNFSNKLSTDCEVNLKRITSQKKARIFTILNENEFPKINENDIIIDAIFGSGLSRQVDGMALSVIKRINHLNNSVIAIDIPSGLFSENNQHNNQSAIIKAKYTLTFQLPKISFLLPNNDIYTGEWIVLDIGLNQNFINSCSSDFIFITDDIVKSILKPRNKFAHKGNFGHGLLIAGSYGKMGAAVLASKACLKCGIGLLTTHVPEKGVDIMQVAIPETMVSIDISSDIITHLPDIKSYSAIGIGPGIGTNRDSFQVLEKLLLNSSQPLVIDADGLNILSQDKNLLNNLSENIILTPHPKEFERLAGKSPQDFEKLKFISGFSRKHKCMVIYKEAYTKIICPDGKIYFNSSGNPGMATAGSGDVLTGMILSFIAQGYNPEHAAVLAVYIHGLAGDISANENSNESLTASDIINNIGSAFKKLK